MLPKTWTDKSQGVSITESVRKTMTVMMVARAVTMNRGGLDRRQRVCDLPNPFPKGRRRGWGGGELPGLLRDERV